jgi:sucrose-6-phosphate hydrolase SacC (GH32 family)
MRASLTLLFCLFVSSNTAAADEPDIVLADFEGDDYGAWRTEGEAFGTRPMRDGKPKPLKTTQYLGKGIAGTEPGKEDLTGTLLSDEFTLDRPYLNFLVAGQRNWAHTVGVELLVDGEVVRSAGATEASDPARAMHWRTLDVAFWSGAKARIRVNDQSTTGAIAVDQLVLSDKPAGMPTDATVRMHETFRPQFHFTAEAGWLNDANGMVYYNGLWHLCHQHLPPGVESKVWGHAVSRDLVYWKHLPMAIANEGEDGIYSGSGWVDVENHSGFQRGEHPPILMFYSLAPPAGSERKMTQCLAISHDAGLTFEKFAGNPILRTEAFRDRDPKVFYYPATNSWYMVLSLSRNNTDRDHATYGLYRSSDVKHWELLQEIGPGAWYWECPDMFELALDGDETKKKWVLMKGSGDYILGSFDGQKFTAETEPIRTRWGGGYYGAQTFSVAPHNRRIQMAWMNVDKTLAPNAWPGMPFNHQMSVPRDLTLRTTPDGPRIYQYPITELSKLRQKTHLHQPRALPAGENALEGVEDELLDIEVAMTLGKAKQVKLNLRGAEFAFDRKNNKLHAFNIAHPLPTPIDPDRLELRILLDRTSAELFVNGGALDVSKVYFPNADHRDCSLTADAPIQIEKLVVAELKSIWFGQ